MKRAVLRGRQRGAVILTVSLMLFFLLGFMAFAVDFARAFVVKTELQSAMDSCALSAAQELDRAADSITRAKSAGTTAGNLNRVHFQSANWSGKGQIDPDVDIKFFDTNYAETSAPSSATYVQCMHTQPDMQMLLLGALNSFVGSTSAFANTHDIVARAVATRASAQSACPIPVALRPKAGHESDPVGSDHGFTTGEWVTMMTDPSTQTFGPGQAGWMNLDGSTNANETKAELNGKCNVQTGDPLGTPGAKVSANDMWNYRFGIYGGGPNQGPSNYGTPGVTNDPNQRPDFTGYSYTATNWPAQSNAYTDFQSKRAAFASCGDTTDTVPACQSITGLSLNSYSKVAVHGVGALGGHWQYGTSRRIVLVPVVSTTQTVKDFACMLMLQPLSIPAAPTVQLEYIGNAGAVGSPCTTNGLPGGTAGPWVPVLVR